MNFLKKCFTENNDRALIIELIQYLNDNPWGDVVESTVPELDNLWSELVGSGKENSEGLEGEPVELPPDIRTEHHGSTVG